MWKLAGWRKVFESNKVNLSLVCGGVSVQTVKSGGLMMNVSAPDTRPYLQTSSSVKWAPTWRAGKVIKAVCGK
jgi:hypothetical protein